MTPQQIEEQYEAWCRLRDKPITIMNYRICHSQKRWAGTIVNDNFGEGLGRAKRSSNIARNKTQIAGVYEGLDGLVNGEWDGAMDIGYMSKFDRSKFSEDYALWERITDNDSNI